MKEMELEEAIKILDNMRKTINESKMLFDEPLTAKLTEENTGLAIKTVLQALKKQDKRIYYLENKARAIIRQEINKRKLDIYINYIPKKKIENKLEELKEKCGGNVFHIQQTLNAEIRLLEELLEEK